MPSASNAKDQPPRRSGKQSSADGTFPEPRSSARILIVEDDYLVALELEHHLLEAGFDVVGTAVTADEAVTKAASQKPDLAIVDIRLSGLRDGIDAAVELSQSLGVVSIFATAHQDPHTRNRAERANPAGWLQKPYAPSRVITLVREALARQRQA